MKLVIIGNGFDLAHGLETGYDKFEEYIKTHDCDEYEFLQKLFSKNINNKEFWCHFEENLVNVEFEAFKDESELLKDKNYINKRLDKLKKLFCIWIKDIDDNDILTKIKKDKLIKHFNDSLVLSLNYTSTVEKLYFKKCYHIHGWIKDVNIDDSETMKSIVLGHAYNSCFLADNGEEINFSEAFFEDNGEIKSLDGAIPVIDFDCSDDENINVELSNSYVYYEGIFTKRCKQIINKDLTGFFRELDRNASNIDEVIVLGHSISNVDINYYKEIVKKLKSQGKKIKWTVSFKKEEQAISEYERKKKEEENQDELEKNLKKADEEAEPSFISID